MANLTEERLKEMEDEMDRFEMEILSTKAAATAADNSAPTRIIGSATYDQVQAQMVANRTEESHAVVAGPSLPPQHNSSSFRNVHSAEPQNYNLRPPPPPPPSFMPHQLRHRPTPPPRPPFLLRGMGGPPSMPLGMMPPPPPPMPMLGQQPQHPRQSTYLMPPPPPPVMPNISFYPQGSNSMMSPPPPFTQASSTETTTIEKPRVVYSAAPVRRMPSDGKSNKSSEDGRNQSDNTTISATSTVVKPPQISLPGIQLNVPVEEIASERLKATGAIGHADPVVAGSSKMEVDAHVPEGSKKEKKEKKKKFVRMAAGTVWEDLTLSEWDPDDFRVFCGDLGNEVTDDTLARAFNKYPSFRKAKVVRDKRSMKTKGFGFVSFKDPNDFVKAIREMNGKYVGNRPIKLRKSCWQDRQIDIVKKKDKEKKKLGFK